MEDSGVLARAIAAMLLCGLSAEDMTIVMAVQPGELDHFLAEHAGAINSAKSRFMSNLDQDAADGRQLSSLFRSSMLFLMDTMNGKTPEDERLNRDFEPLEKVAMPDRVAAAREVIKLKLKIDPSSVSEDLNTIPSPRIGKKKTRTWEYSGEEKK